MTFNKPSKLAASSTGDHQFNCFLKAKSQIADAKRSMCALNLNKLVYDT